MANFKGDLKWRLYLFIYIGFIFSTLSVVGAPLRWLRSMGLLRISLYTIFALCFFTLLTQLIKNHSFQFKRIFIFHLIFLSYYFISQKLMSPEEQIHFLEYGLVGVLFLMALRGVFLSQFKIFFASFFAGSVVGIADEVIQGILPNRHFDINDIWLNMISIALGLSLFSVISKNPSKSH